MHSGMPSSLNCDKKIECHVELTATEGKSLSAVRQNIPVDKTILMCFTLNLCLERISNDSTLKNINRKIAMCVVNNFLL